MIDGLTGRLISWLIVRCSVAKRPRGLWIDGAESDTRDRLGVRHLRQSLQMRYDSLIDSGRFLSSNTRPEQVTGREGVNKKKSTC